MEKATKTPPSIIYYVVIFVFILKKAFVLISVGVVALKIFSTLNYIMQKTSITKYNNIYNK